MALTVISLKWIYREIHGKPPSPRQGHTACVMGDVAYIFGGNRSVDWPKKGTYFFRDLHQLHLYKRMQWEKVRQKGEIPKGRYGHHMCVVGRKIYLFGGKHELQADRCLPGIHVFDTESRVWSELSTSGTEPVAHSSTSAIIGKRIFVFGGMVDGQAVDDTYCFDTESCWWVKLSVKGVPPSPRCDTACTAVGKKLYVFGGSGGPDVWCNDLHVFDTDGLMWTHMNRVEGDPPPERGNHTFVAHTDKDVYVFGGNNDSRSSQPTYGDLYKFSLDKHKWKRPFYSGCAPARRSGHTSVIHKNKLIIIGGSNEDTDFNDVHIAKLINPSKRQPLKVSANDMHEFLSSLNSPEPNTAATPAASDPADGHFHEKPVPEPPEPDEDAESAGSHHSSSRDNEGSIASAGSSNLGGTGKSVHFEDEDEDGGQLSSRSASSSSSAASSATSLSSTASEASTSSGTSEAADSSGEGSPGSNNNNNNNNNSLGPSLPPLRVSNKEDEVSLERMSADGGSIGGGGVQYTLENDKVRVETRRSPAPPMLDKEVQVTSPSTPVDSPAASAKQQEGANELHSLQGVVNPLQMQPEATGGHPHPINPRQAPKTPTGPAASWPPRPFTRGNTISDFRSMQDRQPPAMQPHPGAFEQQQLGMQEQQFGMQPQQHPLQPQLAMQPQQHPMQPQQHPMQPQQLPMQPQQLPMQPQLAMQMQMPQFAEEADDDDEDDDDSGSETGSDSDSEDSGDEDLPVPSDSVQETESEDESESEEEDDEEDDEEEDDDDEGDEEEDEGSAGGSGSGSESESSDESD